MKQDLKKYYTENFGSFSNTTLKEIETRCYSESYLTELPAIFFLAGGRPRSSKKHALKTLHSILNRVLTHAQN